MYAYQSNSLGCVCSGTNHWSQVDINGLHLRCGTGAAYDNLKFYDVNFDKLESLRNFGTAFYNSIQIIISNNLVNVNCHTETRWNSNVWHVNMKQSLNREISYLGIKKLYSLSS